MKSDKKVLSETEIEPEKYTKQQFIESRQYAATRDILMTLLDEKELYTKDDVNRMVSNFLRGVIR